MLNASLLSGFLRLVNLHSRKQTMRGVNDTWPSISPRKRQTLTQWNYVDKLQIGCWIFQWHFLVSWLIAV